MSAYVCAHMYRAYMWAGRRREREQSGGENARGHCEYYIYLGSLQVYILLHSLGETQINIGFSACVMPCIQNPAEAPTSSQRYRLVLLQYTKAPTLCNLSLHKHALHSDLWDKKCVNCSVYKIKPSIWEQHSSPCRASTYSWMQQWKWQLAPWACTAWELVGFIIWCGRKWLTKVFSCLSYYHF